MLDQTIMYRKSSKGLNIDALSHVKGESLYLDDLRELHGTLHAKVLSTTVAHASLLRVDTRKAELQEGIVQIIFAGDIPGENQIGGIVADEVLLVEKEIHFKGQIVCIVVAETEDQAIRARNSIELEYNNKEPVTNPLQAFYNEDFLSEPRSFQLGDVSKGFEQSSVIVSGVAETGGQEHVYLEPQGAYAIPTENGGLKIYSSTQGPTAVQRVVSRILGVGMHRIEVDVLRLGGGFGGKEDQASCWGAVAALSAFLTGKPVKCILDRKEDMQMTGKRNPYISEYKLGLDNDLKIQAFEARYFQNGGAAADLSPAILERTLFHGTNSYFVPNAKLTAYSCRTNLPPNTAFRGFGGPQGMFVIESAIHHAARELHIGAEEIQEANLLKEKDVFPYGQIITSGEARESWFQAKEQYRIDKLRQNISQFNENNLLTKKGMAAMPVCFGISFTNTQMNQARALVHVYHDGTVGVSTGAVEMGQGVNTKIAQIAAREFGIQLDQVKLETTNTTRVANTSPSAASSTTDLNGKALVDAIVQIRNRLFQLAGKEWPTLYPSMLKLHKGTIWAGDRDTGIAWRELIGKAFAQRINLSAKGHYATPKIRFDKSIEKGHPFAYHVFGTAILACTLDCLRGEYKMDKALIIHDCGKTINMAIDLGQTEGGLVQGLGWMTTEEIIYDDAGNLKSNMLANYKIPDIYSVPEDLRVQFLDSESTDMAVYKSKAVGEPPLMYGIGAYFSICNAILAFNPEAKLSYHAPMTPEKALLALYG